MVDEEIAFSLADLADLDISEVAEIRFENLPAGIYGFKVVSAELDEKPNRDNENRMIAIFKFEVVEVNTIIKKGVDKDSLLGKSHTEKLYIVPETQQKVLDGIGRIRAFVSDLGCDSAGKLGDVLAGTVDHTFTGKIAERPNPNDRTQPFAQLKLDARKK
jgi:hypothetical protein